MQFPAPRLELLAILEDFRQVQLARPFDPQLEPEQIAIPRVTLRPELRYLKCRPRFDDASCLISSCN